MLPIYWEQIHQMNSICFTFYFLQFILCIKYFSNLILFVYYLFIVFLLFKIFFFFFLLLSVKGWCLLSGVEEWAVDDRRTLYFCILVGIIYYFKNKLVLHLKFSGTVFYHGRYIFSFCYHSGSEEIWYKKFYRLLENLMTERVKSHNTKLWSLLLGWILSFLYIMNSCTIYHF